MCNLFSGSLDPDIINKDVSERESASGSTCAVLAVVLVEFDENRRGNHQEISQGGCGRVSHNWKPFTKATQTLEHSKR